ncbi:hypothetical protein PG993_005694 [Apiospora rasikravindrae]|uniref:Uncharacterized protein n=1 Tax=Apiospora rasikravindrae TaxID=990691 RepID=A0ABR1TBU7_9PEZI
MPGITTVAATRATRHSQPRQDRPWPVHAKSRVVLSGLILWLPSWENMQRIVWGLDEDSSHLEVKMAQRLCCSFPANRHPDNSKLLYLENASPALTKKSYINTATRYHVDPKYLFPYER